MKKSAIVLVVLAVTLSSSFAWSSTARFKCDRVNGSGPTEAILYIQSPFEVQFRYFPNGAQVDVLGETVSENSSGKTYGNLKEINATTRKVISPVQGNITVDAAMVSANELSDYGKPVRGSVHTELNGDSVLYTCLELFD